MGVATIAGVNFKALIMDANIKKYGFLGIGYLATGLGFIGLFLPLMPTTCFLILAVWAFSKSNPKLAKWILDHPQFGPGISHWIKHKAISRKSKCKISLSIVIGFSISLLIMTPSLLVSALMLSGMLMLLHYINTRAELNQLEKSCRIDLPTVYLKVNK